nr:putative transcription elongation factor SPT5 homolog 1 [Tanacetum cinerariifolium]
MTVEENGRIVNTELHKEATKAYMSYAKSVLLLSDVGDGLKPVHMAYFVSFEMNVFVIVIKAVDLFRYGFRSETPMHPSRNPLHPYMTPMRDSRATPIHDGMGTPMRADNDEPWFLLDILVNVRTSGDDVALSVIREVLLWFNIDLNYDTISSLCSNKVDGTSIKIRRWYNPPWYSEPIPSTSYDPLVLHHAFEKDLDQEKQITASTFMKILNMLLAIGTGSYPFPDPLENDIEIDEPVLAVPTSSHTKRKEEIEREPTEKSYSMMTMLRLIYTQAREQARERENGNKDD